MNKIVYGPSIPRFSSQMHRFYIAPGQLKGTRVVLDEREGHHALHVLRIERGEQVIAMDGQGNQHRCTVDESSRRSVGLQVEDSSFTPRPATQTVLIQAIPKTKAWETILQKSTELSVSRIVPLTTERVVVQLGKETSASKVEKWKAILIDAMKQSGNPWLPQIEQPVALEEFANRKEVFDLSLIGSLQLERKHPRELFRAFNERHGRPPQSVAIWIGPEGDFTAREMELAIAAGAQPISFGPIVLRSDTAVIYSLAIINYELQSSEPMS